MKRMLIAFLSSLFILFSALDTRQAVSTFSFPGASYDSAIVAPEVFLGRGLGVQFTRHHELLGYLEELSSVSPKLNLHTYGRTYEGRELVYVVISSEKNIAAIERLRSGNLCLADPGKKIEDAFYERAPVFVWLSYSIHGNEASSSEAALALVYHLTACRDKEVLELLEDVVVVVDPSLNPDGRERYIGFISSRLGSEPNDCPDSWEHHEPWPTGRFNHYLFDLNRDWCWLTQRESRSRAKAYLSWMPQVHVDFHEMDANSSYFFFPATKPINPNYPTEMIEKWARLFGEENARTFDERGWPYFAGESFDLYYPGYGDSWPTFHGATGMTYEQAGHGEAGIIYRRKDDTLLSLADRINHHFVASLSTIRTAKKYRVERLKSFREFFVEGLRGYKKERVKEYIIAQGEDPHRSAELIALLMEHGVLVEVASSELDASGLYDFSKQRIRRKRFPKGTYVISLRQPLRRFIKSLMEPETALADTFFYDITAWSLPIAYGVEAYYALEPAKGNRELLLESPRVGGSIVGEDPSYGYLIPWSSNGAPKILAKLLDRGFYVRFAGEAFTLHEREFFPGTLIVPRAQNPDTIGAFLSRLASESGTEVYTTETSYTEKGIDLGSDKARFIKRIRVGVVGGQGTSPTSFGALWYLLDEVYGVRHTVIELGNLSKVDLSQYDVMVFPDDEGGEKSSGYRESVDSATVASLKRWIRSGGVYVGMGGGAVFASADRAGLSTVRLKKREKDEKSGEEGLMEKLLSLKEKKKKREMEKIPGTIFMVKLDTDHPLCFGYGQEVKVFKTSRVAFEPIEKGNNVAYFAEKPRVAGFASAENEEFLSLTPFLVEEKLGRGHVVLYLEDPNFRLFWYGLNRLFLNSIFFVPSL